MRNLELVSRSTMPLSPTETRLEEMVELTREWFPVFLRMFRMLAEWSEGRDRDELVLRLADRISRMTREKLGLTRQQEAGELAGETSP